MYHGTLILPCNRYLKQICQNGVWLSRLKCYFDMMGPEVALEHMLIIIWELTAYLLAILAYHHELVDNIYLKLS